MLSPSHLTYGDGAAPGNYVATDINTLGKKGALPGYYLAVVIYPRLQFSTWFRHYDNWR